jgi:hypothetical protein
MIINILINYTNSSKAYTSTGYKRGLDQLYYNQGKCRCKTVAALREFP